VIDPLDIRYEPTPGVKAQAHDKGMMILDARGGLCWELNRTGSKMWDCLSTGISPRETAARLGSVLNANESTVARDAAVLARQLQSAGLLATVEG